MNNISKLYIYKFLNNLSFFGAVSVPFYLQWAKLTYTQMFLLESFFIVFIFILDVPTGILADKFGRKKALFVAALISALGVLTYSGVPNFYLFMLGEFFLALSVALVSGADRALLYDSLKTMKKTKESSHFFSRYAFYGTFGLVIAFPIGSIIAGSNILPYPQTLPLTFFLTAIPVTISAFISLSMKEPKRIRPKESFLKTGIKGFAYLRRHKTLRSFAIDMTLISATTFFIYWFFQPILLNAGVNIVYLGFVSASFNLIGAVLLFKAKRIEKLVGIRKILFLTAFLPALAYIGLSVYHELWFILLGILLIGSLRWYRFPLFDSYLNQYIKSKDRATVLSAISMIQRVATLILYPIVGVLSDISINYTLAMLGIITLVLAFFARVDAKHLRK